MHYCYIIFSQSLDRYYVGESKDVKVRLEQHNSGFFKAAFTKQARDWSLFIIIPCTDISIARKLEKLIKRRKSRKFIEHLKSHPEIIREILKSIT
jgi:putative endonuclease